MDFLTQLRDLPRRYLREDGGIDYGLVALDVGIGSDEELKNFLLQLYRLDLTVAHHVNARLLYFLLGEKVKGKLPVLEVPPESPLAWDHADGACERCPGSEMHEPLPGHRLPLCQNPGRIDRWESCAKYRENLRKAESRMTTGDPTIIEEIRQAHKAQLDRIDAFERATDRMIQNLSR